MVCDRRLRERQAAAGLVDRGGQFGHPDPPAWRLGQPGQNLVFRERDPKAFAEIAIQSLGEPRNPSEVRTPRTLLIVVEPTRFRHDLSLPFQLFTIESFPQI